MNTKQEILEQIQELEKERQKHEWGSCTSDGIGTELFELECELEDLIKNEKVSSFGLYCH